MANAPDCGAAHQPGATAATPEAPRCHPLPGKARTPAARLSVRFPLKPARPRFDMRDNRRTMSSSYILTCRPGPPGLGACQSGFLLERGGNIEEAAQYNDHDTGLFLHARAVQFVASSPRPTCTRHSGTLRRVMPCNGACMPRQSPCARCCWSARKTIASMTCCFAGAACCAWTSAPSSPTTATSTS